MEQFPVVVIVIIFFAVLILSGSIRILREYERGVIFRLGRLIGGGIKGPGLIFLIPVIDKMVRVSLRTVVLDVPPQDIITQDNVSIKVNAVVYFRVVEPQKAEASQHQQAAEDDQETKIREHHGGGRFTQSRRDAKERKTCRLQGWRVEVLRDEGGPSGPALPG